VFSGVFLLDCSLENSVTAGLSSCSIYYSYTFPHKYNLFTFKNVSFFTTCINFRDSTYRPERMATLLEM
jgi:hypothetical protein